MLSADDTHCTTDQNILIYEFDFGHYFQGFICDTILRLLLSLWISSLWFHCYCFCSFPLQYEIGNMYTSVMFLEHSNIWPISIPIPILISLFLSNLYLNYKLRVILSIFLLLLLNRQYLISFVFLCKHNNRCCEIFV